MTAQHSFPAGSACFSGFNSIFPGTQESGFTLKTLGPGFDTSVLQEPGEYHVRFVFTMDACIGSPDASFCLLQLDDPLVIVSNEVEVNTASSIL